MTDSNSGWIKSTCAYCGVGCGIEARPTSLGKLEVRGDKDHPSNYGKLCTKGIALGDTVTPLGRLTQPAHLQNDQKQELDWNSATQLVADKFNQTIEEFGADSVAFYVSGQLLTEDYYVANKLMKGFIGSGNIDSNSRLCMASTVVGHKRAFGADTVPVCYEDLEQAEVVVITGSNLAWCHPVLFQRLRAAKQANPEMKVIVIDPRYTDTCEIADIHLALESGSDVALFNGLLAYLDDNDKLDSDYIEKHTQGFTEVIRTATDYRYTESGWGDKSVPELTGLSEQQLEQFYHLFASKEKVLTIYSQGVNQSTQGCDKVNAIINCHLATGKIGKPGMGPFSVTGQPNAMGGREVGGLANTLAAHFEFGDPQSHQTVSEFWQTDSLATHAGLKAIDLFDAMNEGKIKAVWIMATNPVVSLPDSEKIKTALEKCPFVVVSDCIADTETTRLADVVLPAQGWSEKSGTVTNSERRISRQRRILPSPGEAKPDWWILKEVAQKMGFNEQFDYRHEGEIFKEYSEMTALGNATGKARDLCLIGLTKLDEKGYGDLTPQQWPVLEYQPEIIEQRMFTNGEFFTESGKAQFIAVEHDKPIADTSVEFPLIMNTGRIRDQWHTMSRTGLAAGLGEHTPEPFVAMHPDTVAALGLEEFGLDEFGLDAFNHTTINPVVKVRSAQGECQARLVVTKEMRREQVFMPIHWNAPTAKDSKPCDLILPHTDAASGQPEFKHTPVVVEPCGYRSEAALVSDKVMDCSGFDYWVRQRVEGGFLYRISSSKNPMELVIQLANTLDALPEPNVEAIKSLHYHGNKSFKNYGSAKLDQFGVKQAFVVNSKLDHESIDWLVACLTREADEEFEAEFLSTLAK